MLVAKMKDFGKIMVRVFTKDLRIDSPSAGEFIRYVARNIQLLFKLNIGISTLGFAFVAIGFSLIRFINSH